MLPHAPALQGDSIGCTQYPVKLIVTTDLSLPTAFIVDTRLDFLSGAPDESRITQSTDDRAATSVISGTN